MCPGVESHRHISPSFGLSALLEHYGPVFQRSRCSGEVPRCAPGLKVAPRQLSWADGLAMHKRPPCLYDRVGPVLQLVHGFLDGREGTHRISCILLILFFETRNDNIFCNTQITPSPFCSCHVAFAVVACGQRLE